MRQLILVLAVLLTSPLLCACSGCDTPPSDDLLERIISTLNESWEVVISETQVLCSARDNGTKTLAVAFKPCKDESCLSRAAVTDVTCTSEGMWKQESVDEVPFDSYEALASGHTNCSTCVNGDSFATSYPASRYLDYNETTHCLLLPECFNKDDIITGEMHARHCCVDTEEGVSYTWSGNLVVCVVHGFEKQKYTVFEGESINITFGRDIKGASTINRLSLQGTIASKGDENDHIPIRRDVSSTDVRVIVGFEALSDEVALEGVESVIINFISTIPNFVKRVEDRGDFVVTSTEVYIIDEDTISCYSDKCSTLIATHITARDCCVSLADGFYYEINGECNICRVHGFHKSVYSVKEGESVQIVFGRDVKGKSQFPRLSLQGAITSEGYSTDYEPRVDITVNENDPLSFITITATDDQVALEQDNITLTFTSVFRNFVKRVEKRGEFVRPSTVVTIIDKDTAVAGLTRNDYTFGNDSVRVCVSITQPSGNCPITFPFDLVLRLAPETSAIFEVDTTSFSDGAGIDREGAHDYILLFNPCQREFCFDINLKEGVTRPESGSFSLSVARTPDHGRSITLNPELTFGNIIVVMT